MDMKYIREVEYNGLLFRLLSQSRVDIAIKVTSL